jgi:hypothetical protein
MIGSFPGNRVYVRLEVPRGGIAYKHMEMPELPSYRRQILADSKRTTDLTAYKDALVVQHETDFSISGSALFAIQVSRRADQ